MDRGAIICVDDEAIILVAMIQELKRTFGNQVVYERALNAESALAIIADLQNEGIQTLLVISDWVMPGMTGDEFQAITHERYPDTKFILVTGQADPVAVDAVLLRTGVIGILKKPWRPEDLAGLVSEACQLDPAKA